MPLGSMSYLDSIGDNLVQVFSLVLLFCPLPIHITYLTVGYKPLFLKPTSYCTESTDVCLHP